MGPAKRLLETPTAVKNPQDCHRVTLYPKCDRHPTFESNGAQTGPEIKMRSSPFRHRAETQAEFFDAIDEAQSRRSSKPFLKILDELGQIDSRHRSESDVIFHYPDFLRLPISARTSVKTRLAGIALFGSDSN